MNQSPEPGSGKVASVCEEMPKPYFLSAMPSLQDGMVRGLLRARKQAAIVAKNFDIFGSQGFKETRHRIEQRGCVRTDMTGLRANVVVREVP